MLRFTDISQILSMFTPNTFTTCAVILVLCACAVKCNGEDCEKLIRDALTTFYKGGVGMGDKCEHLKMTLGHDSKCLEKVCSDTNSATRRRSSSLHDESKGTMANGGRELKPGRSIKKVRLHERQKRSLENECVYTINWPINDIYRTLDGSCNNLYNWEWGMADRIQSGYLYAEYDNDGAPRTTGTNGGTLPNARKISQIMHEAAATPEVDAARSLFCMQFGQFAAHDMVLTEHATKPDGSSLKCCGEDAGNAECFTIIVPADDNHFKTGECFDFARSKARLGCNGVREQVNSQSAYFDLSMVYGVTKEESDSLRTLTDGLMKTVLGKLPKDEDDKLCKLSMPSDAENYYCTIAGDARVNEQPGLTSLHTIWTREHNRIAKILKVKHPSWTDEELFQESRKINIAQWQHVVYNEYLPVTVGLTALQNYGIDVAPAGYFKDTYDYTVDATIRNEFAAAIFRFGHSLISDFIALAQVDDEAIIQQEKLEQNFDEPLLYHSNSHKGTDNILKWTSDTPCLQADRKLQPSVQKMLFFDAAINKSRDLAALNIQSHPDDVDLFTGQMSEIRLSGSQLGPTGQCLFMEQFKRLRDGDRFFYERYTSNPSLTFTLNQLSEIKQVRMSTLFCLNTAYKPGKRVQENMFLLQGTGNDYVDCSTVQGIDLMQYW
ncbi:heme peroxidase 2-like isoform X2 [Mercenaria mercenaria]|uniref:heme peroxidase 2-like isoform X2 n=1 Tax=Mercenaria mercenaria TaxID=6596 RepID=UPI00234E8000|nr:heme peroxidase 2-like isoform X2 [Mercenaria mercenaria]